MMAVAKAMRWIGFALMLLTLALAVAAKRGVVESFGPVPVVAVAIILGGTAILLILNDIAIRGMMMQLKMAQRRAEEEAAAEALSAAKVETVAEAGQVGAHRASKMNQFSETGSAKGAKPNEIFPIKP